MSILLYTEDENVLSLLDDWRDNYLACRKEWIEFCDKIGARQFRSHHFKRPSSFLLNHGSDISQFELRTDKGFRKPIQGSMMEDMVLRLPEPRNFDLFCQEELGLCLSWLGTSLSQGPCYHLVWTPRNNYVIKGPDFEPLEKQFGLGINSIWEGKFESITKKRLKYWFARDQLIVSGEDPD